MAVDSEGRITLNDKQRGIVSQRIKTAVRWADERQQLTDADQGKFQSRSERNLALVRGRYWHKVKAKDVQSINHLAKALKVKHTVVTGGDTAFVTTARAERYTDIQDVAKGLLNHLWDSLGLDRQCDMAAWDSMIHPTGGVVEIGWRYKDRNIERTGERPDDMEILDEEAKSGGLEPAMVGSSPIDPYQVMEPPYQEFGSEEEAMMAFQEEPELPQPEVEPEIDDPFVERFDSRELLVDPACTSFTLDGARYAFRHKWELLSRVKKNPRYKNTRGLKGTAYGFYPDEKQESKPPDDVVDDVLRVELFDGYAYMTLEGKEEKLYHIVWAKELGKELLCEPAWCEYFKDPLCESPFPFEVMPAFVPDNDSIDTVPDVELARDIQVMHDLALTQVEWQRAHSPNVLKVPTGTFAGEDGERTKKRIEEGRENTVLELDPAYLRDVVWMDRPQLHADAYQSLDSAPRRIMDEIGISEFQSNMLPDKEMTKAEVSTLSTQGGTRQDQEVERYWKFLERVAFKVLILLQQYQARVREYSFTTAEGEQLWGKASMVELRGGIVPDSVTDENPLGDLEDPGIQLAISIDASKKRPKNEYLERQEAVELLGALEKYSQMPDPRLPARQLVNLPALIRGVVEKYDLPNINDIIPPEPTEEELAAFQEEQQRQAEEQMRMQQEQAAMAAQQQQQAMEAQMMQKQADQEGKIQLEAVKQLGKMPGGM
jgi:hypothetical protein